MKKKLILVPTLMSITAMAHAQVTDSTANYNQIVTIASTVIKEVVKNLPSSVSQFAGVIATVSTLLIGMGAAWAIHHFGVKKGASIVNDANKK